MQFQELSEILKNKREEKHITQQELAQKLKIPLRGLMALEEGKLDELPHETYVRTFIKEYAKYVDLDHDEVRAMLNTVDEFQTYVQPPKSMETKHAESEPKGTKSKSMRIAIQLLLLALIGTTVYFYYVSGRGESESISSLFSWSSSEEVSDNSFLREENKQANVAYTETTEETIDAVSDESLSDLVQGELIEEPLVIQEEAPIVDEAAQANMAFETFFATTPEATLIDWSDFDKTGNLSTQAVIYVNQDCWMQVVVDGNLTHFTLPKGAQRMFKFNKSIQFKLGRGSAVTLFHGYDLVKVGDSSALRTVVLEAK